LSYDLHTLFGMGLKRSKLIMWKFTVHNYVAVCPIQRTIIIKQ